MLESQWKKKVEEETRNISEKHDRDQVDVWEAETDESLEQTVLHFSVFCRGTAK